MAKICVFCSSANEPKEEFQKVAKDLGNLLAERGHHLIYGGSHRGLMGDLSKEFFKKSKKITEVVPKIFEDRTVGNGESVVLDTIQERMDHMLKISDGFIALPGGIGTLQEIVTVLVSNQIANQFGHSNKPMSLINLGGIFDHHLNLLTELNKQGLLPAETMNHSHVANSAEEALDHIEENL